MSDVRERHQRIVPPSYKAHEGAWCEYCAKPWPCDAIRMADDADRLAAALRLGIAWFHADDTMRGEEGGAYVHWMQRADDKRLEFIAAARKAIDAYDEEPTR